MTGERRRHPSHNLILRLLPIQLAVCTLPVDTPIPAWAITGMFQSITRTGDELSVVCPFEAVPPGVEREGPWACLEVEGPLDFVLTGILAGLSVPLAEAGISIFAISTYLTDYVLVLSTDVEAAVEVLRTAGYTIL